MDYYLFDYQFTSETLFGNRTNNKINNMFLIKFKQNMIDYIDSNNYINRTIGNDEFNFSHWSYYFISVEKRESMKGKQKERRNYRLIDYREEFSHSLVRAG